MPDPLWLLVQALAVYRLTRLVTRDSLSAPLRQRLERRHERAQHPLAPVSAQVAGFFSELLLCSWCLSVWVAAIVVGATSPADSPILPLVLTQLAVAAVAGLLLDRDRS